MTIAEPPAGEASSSDERRQLILNAAQELIVREGLEGFRIREVAQRAGMHHASLLHYFPNREALIRGVIERIVAQVERLLEANGTAGFADPQRVLHTHFQTILLQMERRPEHFVVLNELLARSMRDADVKSAFAPADERWRRYLVQIFSSGVAQGVFRPDLDPSTAATIVISFCKGLSQQHNLSLEQRHAAVDQLERWLLCR